MGLALQDLCQGGLLGDAEMVVWYGFREAEGNDLVAGRYIFWFIFLVALSDSTQHPRPFLPQ